VEVPSDEVCAEIVEQVEFYFSNANITKDKFLLKHVKRNKEGFVSLKLVSSFKRVKHLTKDWRQVSLSCLVSIGKLTKIGTFYLGCSGSGKEVREVGGQRLED
jgi:hypothetical protein